MGKFIIKGGKPLKGTIEAKGAKNEAYQVICASLLTEEPVIIKNVPEIIDIKRLIEIIKILGAKVEKINSTDYKIDASNLSRGSFENPEYINLASKIRGSAMLVAPLLAKFGHAVIPKPGGDRIGRRPLDTHFQGFMKLGAKVKFNSTDNKYEINIKKPVGAYILLEEASLTATANILMLSVLAEGNTTIFNAACEPYIVQLCKMLNKMGANIKGIGSNLLEIEGVDSLSGTTHRVIGDIIEIGTFIGLAATTNSDIKISNVPINYIEPILTSFRKLGIKILIENDILHVQPQEKYKIHKQMDGGILHISDNPWPKFPADLISVILVTASQAQGTLLVRQRMFESRLFFVDHLIEMGAQIILCDPHRAVVIGTGREFKLKPSIISSPDIRAGLALLIAALAAEGESIIENIGQIDRGYENIDERLRKLGADIQRVE